MRAQTVMPVVIAALPAFVPLDVWSQVSGMSRSSTYLRMAEGHIPARKIGRRTLIDLQAGLAWIKAQPGAYVNGAATLQLAA